eukprot:scaffold64920_cov24-Tisochrysis_lutea.AAC.1
MQQLTVSELDLMRVAVGSPFPRYPDHVAEQAIALDLDVLVDTHQLHRAALVFQLNQASGLLSNAVGISAQHQFAQPAAGLRERSE